MDAHRANAPHRRPTSVMVFETHPAVLAGLVRRLDSESSVRVVGSYVNAEDLAVAVARFNPDLVVIGMFGPGGTPAANLVDAASSRTRVIVVTPGLRADASLGLPRSALVIEDGPRGDALARVVADATYALI